MRAFLLIALLPFITYAAEVRVYVTESELDSLPAFAVVQQIGSLPYYSAYWDDSQGVPDNPAHYADRVLEPQYGDVVQDPYIGIQARVASGWDASGLTVGIIDSGIDTAHTVFAGKTIHELCRSTGSISFSSLCPNGQDSQDGPGSAAPCVGPTDCRHGTHVSHLASAVASGADLAHCQAFVSWPALGRVIAKTSDIARCLDAMYDNATVWNLAAISISVGSTFGSATICDEPLIADAVERLLVDKRVRVFFAAGNRGAAEVSYPGCVEFAVPVGALDKASLNGAAPVLWPSTNTPPVSVFDPVYTIGCPVVAAIPGGGMTSLCGTSQASPIAVGIYTLFRTHVDRDHALLATKSNGQAFLLGKIAGAIDNDGIADSMDNCSIVPNSAQRDTDSDGYGNMCDPDLNNDGSVQILDLAYMRSVYGITDADADLDGSGIVDQPDSDILRAMMYGPPGPSGVAP